MDDLVDGFLDPRVVAGRHLPDCDSQLGPEFEVRKGEVLMTLHICTGCLPSDLR